MSNWPVKIESANKYFKEWENRYSCKKLQDYFRGFQWKNKVDLTQVQAYRPYTINLFYSTMKIKMASVVFQRPTFQISPSPGNSSWDLETAVRGAELKQDALNAVIKNPNSNFKKHIKRAAKDSLSYFGIIEVGYAADWINPQKSDMLLLSDTEEEPVVEDKVIEENELPLSERFYFKRIKPNRFRVSVSDAEDLNDHDWVGYCEWFYTNQLKKTKGIKLPKDFQSSSLSSDYSSGFIGDADISDKFREFQSAGGGITKVWNIFDLKEKKRCLVLDGSGEEIWEADMERLPLIDHRWDEEDEGFYPVPPAFQWISSQDEINEAREQTRSFRRRFTRKFQAVKNNVDPEEMEKFASGPDGVIIEVKVQDAISPIQNPEQGPTAQEALIIAKDDFNIISGTSAEARGQSSDRETATQAKIVDARSQIRESADQLEFSDFVCLIGRETLMQMKEKMTEGMWVKYTVSPDEQNALTEVQQNKPFYKYITAHDIDDGYDFLIEIDVTNATPQAQAQASQSFIQFLSLCHQFPEITMSPVLIREAAYRSGYRNERVIHQMQQVALLAMAAKAHQAQIQSGQSPGLGLGGGGQTQNAQGANADNVSKAQVSQMQPGTEEQVKQQLNQQLM